MTEAERKAEGRKRKKLGQVPARGWIRGKDKPELEKMMEKAEKEMKDEK